MVFFTVHDARVGHLLHREVMGVGHAGSLQGGYGAALRGRFVVTDAG